jgi:hypothetical protein
MNFATDKASTFFGQSAITDLCGTSYQGLIFRILQHFATTFCNITNFACGALKALLHNAIFLVTCIARDVKGCEIGKYESSSDFPNEFFTNKTVFTNLHVLEAELRCKKNCIV